MVKTLKHLVLLSCFTSGIATILSLVSLGSQQWIVSSGVVVAENYESQQESEVKYGLFAGVLKLVNGGQARAYEIQTTCLVKDNICAMLCGLTDESRRKELGSLKNRESVNFNENCPQIKKILKPAFFKVETAKAPENPTFINAGVLISTVVFLCISSLFGILVCFLAIWNTGGNPIQTVFSVPAMYVYNAISAVTLLLAISIWGIEYTTKLIDNVCIFYSIVGIMSTKGLAQLGFSYWITIPALFLYIASLFILYARDFKIKRQPLAVVEMDDNNENLILF